MGEIGSWVNEHQVLVTAIFIASLVLFFGTLAVTPVIVRRLPANYFADTPQEHRKRRKPNTPLRLLWRIGRNIIGVILILAGIAMLVLPGQGILTILIGLLCVDLPGKYTLTRALVRRPKVLKGLNWIRSRGGKPPLEVERSTGRDAQDQHRSQDAGESS